MSSQSASDNLDTQHKSWADMVEEDEDELDLNQSGNETSSPVMKQMSPSSPTMSAASNLLASKPSLQQQSRSLPTPAPITPDTRPSLNSLSTKPVNDLPEWRRHDDQLASKEPTRSNHNNQGEWWEHDVKPAPAYVDIDQLSSWRRPAHLPPTLTNTPDRHRRERQSRRRSSASSSSSMEGPRQSTVVYWHNSTEDDDAPKTDQSDFAKQHPVGSEDRTDSRKQDVEFSGDPLQRWHTYALAEQQLSLQEEQEQKSRNASRITGDIVSPVDEPVDTGVPQTTSTSNEDPVNVAIEKDTHLVEPSVLDGIANSALASDGLSYSIEKKAKNVSEPLVKENCLSETLSQTVTLPTNSDQTAYSNHSIPHVNSQAQSNHVHKWNSLDLTFARPSPPKPAPVKDRASSWQAFAQAHKKTSVPEVEIAQTTDKGWQESQPSPPPDDPSALSAASSAQTAPLLRNDNEQQPIYDPKVSSDLKEQPSWGPVTVPWATSEEPVHISLSNLEQSGQTKPVHISLSNLEQSGQTMPVHISLSNLEQSEQTKPVHISLSNLELNGQPKPIQNQRKQPSHTEQQTALPDSQQLYNRTEKHTSNGSSWQEQTTQPRRRPRILMSPHFKLMEKAIARAANHPSN